MNNKNILRAAFPFIVIFIVSLIIAGYTFVRKNLSDVKAGDEALSVTLVNTKDPLTTNEAWEWKMISSADRAPDPPIQLTYMANWCLEQDSTEPCIKGVTQDFFYQVGSGNVSINTRETTAQITHQSVNCGRIELEILRDGQTISRTTHSTATRCTKSLSDNVSAYADSPAELAELINQVIKIILGLFDDDQNDNDENPINTPGNPGTPGTPETPGGQLCRAQGDACEEAYREACGEGTDAGTRVCYKRGTCAAPGSGVQCSWGPDSFCDPCEPGTKIDDPVPPMKPPQNPPANPGNPGNPGGGNPEPMPIPADADAQKAVALSDFLYRQCKFTVGGTKVDGMVTQYNVDACIGGEIGTKDDDQAKAEVSYSAHNIGAGQRRNNKVIGYNHLQCVGFVEGAVAAATGRDYSGPTGNAQARCQNSGDYNCVRIGNNFSRVSQEAPRPNDLAVWGTSQWGPFGHIAYVVSTTAGSFTVVEANNSCIGCVRRFTYVTESEIASHNLAGFLRRN